MWWKDNNQKGRLPRNIPYCRCNLTMRQNFIIKQIKAYEISFSNDIMLNPCHNSNVYSHELNKFIIEDQQLFVLRDNNTDMGN